MNRAVRLALGIVGVAACLAAPCMRPAHAEEAASAACTPPTSVAATPEQTAWQLFVAATCPVNANTYPYVTWQTWIEQNQLYGGSSSVAAGERPPFHMSPLAAMLRAQAEAHAHAKDKRHAAAGKTAAAPEVANQNCNSDTWSKRTICEEARLNADAQQYVSSQGLATRPGQVAFINAGKTFMFPAPAVELKADWIQLTSCNNLPQGVHVEKVDNVCYALGGIHHFKIDRQMDLGHVRATEHVDQFATLQGAWLQ